MRIKRKTKVILWKTVESLGERGKVLDVAGGFARNYLFPSRLAREATPSNLKFFNQELRQIQKKEEGEKILFNQVAQKWNQKSLVFEVKSNEKGELYGSLTAADVLDQLHNQGETAVEESMIRIDHPLKELGVHTFHLKLGYGISASLWAWIVEKNL